MKIKVIVIDDDHLVALSLKTILEASGNIERDEQVQMVAEEPVKYGE